MSSHPFLSKPVFITAQNKLHVTMATPNRKCLLSTCSNSGQLQTYKKQGLLKVIECAFQRQDGEMRTTVQAVLDSQGEQASMEMHKNCYCSCTSKEHIKRF